MESKQQITPQLDTQRPVPNEQPNGHAFDQVMFPSQNKPALLSYYFGCAGFLPFIGLPFSVLAVRFGHRALKQNEAQPVPGAKGHAKIGIILGYFELIVFLLFLALMVYFYLTRPDKSQYRL